MNIRVGQKAPDFSASAVFAENFLTVKVSDYFNEKYIILFFYPLDLLLFFQWKLLLLLTDLRNMELLYKFLVANNAEIKNKKAALKSYKKNSRK